MQVVATEGLAYAGSGPSASVNITCEGVDARSVSVAGLASDEEVDLAFTMAQLNAILIKVSGELTLVTNVALGGAGTDTFTLNGSEPFFWTKNSGITNPFTSNVTKLFFTNAAADAVTVEILVARDATP